MNWEEQLNSIFEEPAFADVKPMESRPTSSDRLIASFEEINAFYDEHGRLPSLTAGMNEKILARRLEGICADLDKQKRCLPYDRHSLIATQEVDVNKELESIFNDPIFNISATEASLFDVPEHLRKEVDKAETDFVAQRRRCESFDEYKHLFLDAHKELKSGSRRVVKFNESQLQEGTIFMVGGVLVLLNKIFEKRKDKNYKTDGRTHCVFENGTESNMLLRSLGKALYLDGYALSENSASVESHFAEAFNVAEEDKQTGYIYVLRSKSENPAITQYKDLYKIGFTTTTVEQRIANASAQTTYLLDEVEIIATWKCFNLNAKYFEGLIHELFNEVQLQVKIHHESGIVIVPHEWFVVPLSIIQSAVNCIIKGVPVSYNAKEKVLEEHKIFTPKIDASRLKTLQLNVSESYFKEVRNGVRRVVEKRLTDANAKKFTYIDRTTKKRWLVKYDAIKFITEIDGKRHVEFVLISDIRLNRDTNTICYELKTEDESRRNLM